MRDRNTEGGPLLAPRPRPRPRRRLRRELRADFVGALAARIPGGVRDPEFLALLESIDEDVFHGDNEVQAFFDGNQAFASMLEAVASAQKEVLLEAYIFKDDAAGKRFQEELVGATRRGVTVRVLADAIGSWETRRAFWEDMRKGGVEARLFHPPWNLRFLKFRDHRKILVADRRVAYTGGMNIGEEYGSSLAPSGGSSGSGDRVWRDTHARVEGPAAWEMAVVFEEGWKHAGGKPIGLEPLKPGGSSGARVLVLDSRPGRGNKEVSSAFAAIAGGARDRLWITMAYFAPHQRVVRILGEAAARGVDVRLLVPGKSDVQIVRHAGHGFYSDLLDRGVRVFEYQTAVLHAKTLVADGYMSAVGSSNLDFRSFELNAECNFVIAHDQTGRAMDEQYETDLARSIEVVLPAWRARPWHHRAGDALARRLAPML
ncbi:MAG: phospholipase D-like domain-containing protein [Thermoanaerobaculia bacterium]